MEKLLLKFVETVLAIELSEDLILSAYAVAERVTAVGLMAEILAVTEKCVRRVPSETTKHAAAGEKVVQFVPDFGAP